MAREEDSDRSRGGSPIYRHGEPTSREVGASGVHMEQICAHIERHIGTIEQVFHEIVSDTVHIDVHHVAPTAVRPFHTLVTTGMSDLPMTVPAGIDAPRHLELMVTLPESWKIGDAVSADEKWYWPIRQLKLLARFPHLHGTWLGWGHTVPNGDPAQAFAPGTKLCGAIIAPSLLVPAAFYELDTGETRIAFYSVVPLYKEELDLKLNEGMDALLARLVEHDINDVVEPRRKNVAKRFLGLF